MLSWRFRHVHFYRVALHLVLSKRQFHHEALIGIPQRCMYG